MTINLHHQMQLGILLAIPSNSDGQEARIMPEKISLKRVCTTKNTKI